MHSNLTPISRILLATALFLLLWLALPFLKLGQGLHPLVYLLAEIAMTVVWVGLVLLLVYAISVARLGLWQTIAGVAIGLVVWAVSQFFGAPGYVTNLALIYWATLVGCMLAFLFREPNILLPVALLAPLVDFWTVTVGPVSQVIEERPEILPAVTATLPSPVDLQPVALVGAGDFLFMGMFLAAAFRLGMSPIRTARLFFVLVVLALLIVFVLGQNIPGLIVIGLGFIAANLKHFRLSKQEMAITVGLVVTVGVAVAIIGFRVF